MGGVELAKQVPPEHPHMKVVYMSGHPFEELDLPDLDPLREHYLAKPFSPGQLRECVKRTLDVGERSEGATETVPATSDA